MITLNRFKSSILRQFTTVKSLKDIQIHENPTYTKVLLNRPKALNALSLEMIRQLRKQLPNWSNKKAIWFQGVGGKAFCAGGDVKNLFQKGATLQDRLTFFRQQFSLDYKISQLSSKQIANWDGIVMGGGYGITGSAKYKIASQNSLFAMPQGKLGFFTDVASCFALSRLPKGLGLYLGLTGARLKGQDLYLSGLANYFIPRQKIAPLYTQLTKQLQTQSKSQQTIQKIFSKYHTNPSKKEFPLLKQIGQLFQGSYKDIYRRAEKQNNDLTKSVYKFLLEQSPLSVGIVHRLINTARDMNLKQCFLRDYKLCQHAIADPNFAQGVRTVLVEKGSKPNWSHKHILQVQQSDVDKYFTFPSNFQQLPV